MTTQTKTRQSATRPAVAAGSETSRLNAATADDVKRGFIRRRWGAEQVSASIIQLRCRIYDNLQPRKGEKLLLRLEIHFCSLFFPEAATSEKKTLKDGCILTNSQKTALLFSRLLLKYNRPNCIHQTSLNFAAASVSHLRGLKRKMRGRFQTQEAGGETHSWQPRGSDHTLSVWMMSFSALEFIFSGPERNPTLWLGVRPTTSRTGSSYGSNFGLLIWNL